MFSPLPTVFHLTHPKAGSHWVSQVLSACAPERILLFNPFLPLRLQPILPGMVYPTLYVTRDEFEAMNPPEFHRKFFVIRDLRDTLISAYFSYRYSHIPLYHSSDRYRRAQLNSRSLEEGLRHLMHIALPRYANIQSSWMQADVLLVRYEDLLQDELGQFARILAHCQIALAPAQLRQITQTFSFERWSGRPKGSEDIMSHLRKGVAGDWRNYLRGDLLAEFKEFYDAALIETGYETSRDWGLADLPRVYARPNQVEALSERRRSRSLCWCQSDRLGPFSPDYNKCLTCGTLVYKYQLTVDDLAVTDNETDLYGRNYWLAPRFYNNRPARSNIYERLRHDLAHEYILKRLQVMLKYLPPAARVLDVGCGPGTLVFLLRQAGFDAAGLEVSQWLVELVRQTFDIPVYTGQLEQQDFTPASFEAIVLLDVLEHLPQPLDALQRCRQWLTAAGLLFIQTPLFNPERTFESLRSGGSPLLAQLRPVEHLHLFTQSSLQLLLERAGYEWVSFEAEPWVIAGRSPVSSRQEAEVTAALAVSGSGRLVQALLDQAHELERAQKRREEDYTLAFRQLAHFLTPSPSLSLQHDLITTGQGWHQVETFGADTFCWIANDAELIIERPTGRRTRLSLEVEPGPGLNRQPLHLQVLDETGRLVAAAAKAIGRQRVEVKLPVKPGPRAVFRLHVEGGGHPTPNDPRILNFRVFNFGWM